MLPGSALGVSSNLLKMLSGAESRDVIRLTPRCLAVSGTTCSITICLAHKIGQSGLDCKGRPGSAPTEQLLGLISYQAAEHRYSLRWVVLTGLFSLFLLAAPSLVMAGGGSRVSVG